jgi:hypothetical protein
MALRVAKCRRLAGHCRDSRCAWSHTASRSAGSSLMWRMSSTPSGSTSPGRSPCGRTRQRACHALSARQHRSRSCRRRTAPVRRDTLQQPAPGRRREGPVSGRLAGTTARQRGQGRRSGPAEVRATASRTAACSLAMMRRRPWRSCRARSAAAAAGSTGFCPITWSMYSAEIVPP